MKVREGFTLGRLQVGVCGLPHPRPMFFGLQKKHRTIAHKDHWHKQTLYAPDQGSDTRLLHDGSPFVAMG